MTCCAAAVLLGAPSRSWADVRLWDWMFGHGQTTYAPPYCPPNVSTAAAPRGCGWPGRQCAPAQPACQPCVPTATYRISYRPVPTVAYMPVVSIDPCSGCAVTTYRPTRAWTYQASLVPYPTYRVGYAPRVAACGGCLRQLRRLLVRSLRRLFVVRRHYGGCSSCGTITAAARRATPVSPAAMSRRADAHRVPRVRPPLSGTLLPGPGDMSRPPATYSPSTAPRRRRRLARRRACRQRPVLHPECPRPTPPAPLRPDLAECARAGASPSGTSYRGPAVQRGQPHCRAAADPEHPASSQQSQRSATGPPPLPRPENENRTTSRPVLQATYFQLLPSLRPSVPAQLISAPTCRPRRNR